MRTSFETNYLINMFLNANLAADIRLVHILKMSAISLSPRYVLPLARPEEAEEEEQKATFGVY
jgi:hypothetical protein